MKHLRLSLPAILIVCLTLSAFGQKKEIIGYYPSWKWRSRDNLVTPDRIPFHKLTIINYAFFYPLPDGSIVGRDSVGDTMILRGKHDPGTGGYDSTSTLSFLAHRNGVRVLLSLGGWADSYNFPEVAASAEKRAWFAHSCIERIKQFDFDGIDIDWEYPGYAVHKGTPQDAKNFTLLLQATRDSLNAYGRKKESSFLLTAALPANPSAQASMEVDKIAAILDQLNIMTYDFSGPWDSLSYHNAPLYTGQQDDSTRSADASFRIYHEAYGIPAGKINLGVPFYGHTFSHCTALRTPHSGSDTVHFTNEGSSYYDIVARLDNFTRYWDDRAKAPFLVSKDWDMLVSYDDEESVRYKAQYVVDNGACGLIIWEITGDYMPDHRTPLLDVIYSTFNGARGRHD